MARYSTVIMDDNTYEELIEMIIGSRGTTRRSSGILGWPLGDGLSGREELARLIYSEKIGEVSMDELNAFRRELDKRFASR